MTRQVLRVLRGRNLRSGGVRRPTAAGTERRPATDGGRVVVPLSDRASLRGELERFAAGAFEERSDGSLACDFAGVTHFTVLPDGRVDTGMPLHSFGGPADRLVFDHERGEVTVEFDAGEETLAYTFRRP